MRRHRTKQPIGPATAPSIAAPATARQNSSSIMMMPVMAAMVMGRGMNNRARGAVGMIVAMGVEGDLVGHIWAEQSDEGRIAHHGCRVAFTANMPIETDDMVGRGHHDVKVVT